MGRKDAAARATPVEQYRKQIGKQDWKKSKKDVKLTKEIANKKKSFGETTKNAFLILLAIIAIFIGVYFILYFSISRGNSD